MGIAPTPEEIFKRAAQEGERRLDQSPLELTATSFIAGFTIVFGIVGQGIAHAAAAPVLGEMAKLVGALAFAIGLVLLIVGRAELFTENFFDPAATLFEKRDTGLIGRLLRLWGLTFVLNFVGALLFALVVSVDGAFPKPAEESLVRVAEEIVDRGGWAAFVSAIIGGALIALLSFLLVAVNSVGSRIVCAYLVGFLLALGPFDHVVVTVVHVFFGILFDAPIAFTDMLRVMSIATAGNFVGGVGLVTLSHVAQAKGAEASHR